MKYYCENCGIEIDDSDCYHFPIEETDNCPICGSIDSLREIPYNETVASWEDRKGRKYPDAALVYVMREIGDWEVISYLSARNEKLKNCELVVVTESGFLDNDWRPE